MSDFITHIARSLGRAAPLESLQVAPPRIDPAVARLVSESADLVARFVATATAAKMRVVEASLDTLPTQLIAELQRSDLRSGVITRCGVCEGLRGQLREAGFAVEFWSDTTLDAAYDVDFGLTDVYRAVAETGSIVIRESTEHGRAVSLVPAVHFAIVHRSQIVADLIDLMADVQRDGSGSGLVIITGPSKTADIEMNLVTGVHGPGEVILFLLD